MTLDRSQACPITHPGAALQGSESAFEPVAQPFHSGDVTDIDTCIRKPLAVSCSSDLLGMQASHAFSQRLPCLHFEYGTGASPVGKSLSRNAGFTSASGTTTRGKPACALHAGSQATVCTTYECCMLTAGLAVHALPGYCCSPIHCPSVAQLRSTCLS